MHGFIYARCGDCSKVKEHVLGEVTLCIIFWRATSLRELGSKSMIGYYKSYNKK